MRNGDRDVHRRREEARGELRARGLDVTIDQCKASEVGSKASAYDLVVSTTEVDDTRGKPYLRTLSFLTGIGIDADVDKIAKLLSA